MVPFSGAPEDLVVGTCRGWLQYYKRFELQDYVPRDHNKVLVEGSTGGCERRARTPRIRGVGK